MNNDTPVIVNSPDPDDNYIFSLAINSNAKAIVCGEKSLLNWNATPVKIISKNEFESLY